MGNNVSVEEGKSTLRPLPDLLPDIVGQSLGASAENDSPQQVMEHLSTTSYDTFKKTFESPEGSSSVIVSTRIGSGDIEDHPDTSTPTEEQPRRKLHFPLQIKNDSGSSSSLGVSSSSITSPEGLVGSLNNNSRDTASLSFEERFKHKISIYSKVSGCRMTNVPDYTIVKQVRVVILDQIALGNPNEVLKVKFAYEKMKNGGLQIITDDKRLSDALSGLSYFATIPCKMTFPNSPRVVGFVRDLPMDLEPADLKKEIRKVMPEVYSVRYITEKSGSQNRPSQLPCAFISFNLRYLPGSVFVFEKEYEVQVPNPMQCTRCCRYGHQGKQCRAEIRCPVCSNSHTKQLCSSVYFRCVNCKGSHSSTSHECFVWQQGKLMNELRYRGGLTAEEAIDVATHGKIQHKKHSFTFPSEYFDNLESFYVDSGDTSGGSDDADLQNSGSTNNNPTLTSPESDSPSTYTTRRFFHEKYLESQLFLDVITDLFLQLTNPGENYTSQILMPGFEDDSMMERLNFNGQKKTSKVAELFKLSVLQALESEGENFKECINYK